MIYQVKSKADLDAQLKEASDKVVLIFFYATCCGSCKKIAPVVDTIGEQFEENLVILKVDWEEVEKPVTDEYEITGPPTFVLFRHGHKVKQWTGANEEKLSYMIGTAL